VRSEVRGCSTDAGLAPDRGPVSPSTTTGGPRRVFTAIAEDLGAEELRAAKIGQRDKKNGRGPGGH